MTHKLLIRIELVILAFMAICVASAAAFQIVITQASPAPKQVELKRFLIDSSILPEGWEQVDGPAGLPAEFNEGSIENIYTTFKRPFRIGAIAYTVYRYRNNLTAMLYWGLRLNSPPQGWNYWPSNADQFSIGCEEISNTSSTDPSVQAFRVCTARARYGEFIYTLEAPIQPSALSVPEMEQIIRAADARMLQHLR